MNEIFYPGHCVVIRLLLRIGPVYDDVASKNLHSAGTQTSFGQRCRLVRIVLQEAETAVFPAVIRRTVNDYLR
jgi:hypothetical protein